MAVIEPRRDASGHRRPSSGAANRKELCSPRKSLRSLRSTFQAHEGEANRNAEAGALPHTNPLPVPVRRNNRSKASNRFLKLQHVLERD